MVAEWMKISLTKTFSSLCPVVGHQNFGTNDTTTKDILYVLLISAYAVGVVKLFFAEI